MQLATPSTYKHPFNPRILEWARNYAGYSLDIAAQELKISKEQLSEWENVNSNSLPSITKAEKMATLYGRPVLEFYFKKVPDLKPYSLVPDFRCVQGMAVEKERPFLLRLQRWGEEQRLNLLDLAEMLEVDIPDLPSEIFTEDLDDVECVAGRAREILGPNIDKQIGLKSSEKSQFPAMLREHLSHRGVLVLYRSELINAKIRGMCLFSSRLPTIIFTKEAPNAQAFTIAHELGHVVSKQRAISGTFSVSQPNTWKHKEVEQWCDRFAAAFLVPAAAINEIKSNPAHPVDHIGDNELNSLAKRFAVSEHAMLIRLIELGYVHRDFYWLQKRKELIQREFEHKSARGRSRFYASQFQNRVGNFYTGLVLEAWDSGEITADNAAEFMGIKRLQHLDEIHRNFCV